MKLELVRKSLPTLLREAAAEQGLTLTAVHMPEFGGWLGYRSDGPDTKVYTPGEMAKRLGVVWP